AGPLLIAQTANILLYLGGRLGLAPREEAGRLWVHQLQLTIADLVALIHDTHHPITGYLYYEEQRAAAKLATKYFWRYRLPKFLRYFERVLQKSSGPYLLGRRLTYADLSLFQIVEGLRYAFPRRMKRFERKVPRVIALHARVDAHAGRGGVHRHQPPTAAGASRAIARNPRGPAGERQRQVRRLRFPQERQHRGGRRLAHVPGHRHRHHHGQEGTARLHRRR